MPPTASSVFAECRDARDLWGRPWVAGRLLGGRVLPRWLKGSPTADEIFAQQACALFDPTQADGFVFRQRAWRLAERVDAWRMKPPICSLDGEALRAALPAAPVLLVASHAGAGGGLWRLLQRLGRRAAFVAKAPVAADFGRAWVAQRYGLWRGREALLSGCAGVIGTGGAARAMQRAWQQGQDVVVLPDAPGEGRHTWVRAGPGLLRVRTGALTLAHQAGIRALFLGFGGDPFSGKRSLTVASPTVSDPQTLAETFGQAWALTAAHDAAAWPLWGCGLWRRCEP